MFTTKILIIALVAVFGKRVTHAETSDKDLCVIKCKLSDNKVECIKRCEK